ncbi:MAG: DUF429 domain-containing protein [Acidobacteriota bacterium]
MLVVLGIDAAWTPHHPSGIALVRARGRRWECLAVAPSYASFGASVNWRARPVPGAADCDALVAIATRLAGAPPDVVAIDMPLQASPITRRRAADDACARALARYKLGVHSPVIASATAEAMRAGFERHGYALATTDASPRRALIEVFPHAAAIALVGASCRVPYKLARAAQYWPSRSPLARRRALLARWASLRRALARTIDGGLPRIAPGTPLKRHEDALDAVICAWLGIEYLAGRLRPHGDDTAAVWLPG